MGRLTSWCAAACALTTLACAHRPELPAPSQPLVATPDAPFRASAPAIGDDAPFEPPAVRREVLENGLEVWVVERKELPNARLMIANRAARGATEPRLAGLARLTAAQLERGPFDHAGREGQTGGSIQARVDAWGTTAYLDATANEAPFAFRKLARKVRYPRFRDHHIAEERLDQLYAIRHGGYSPASAAQRHALELLYGRWHPRANPELGFPDAVRGFGKDQVRRFWAATYAPENSAVILVGDVDPDLMTTIVRQELGDWARQADPLEPEGTAPEAPNTGSRRLQVLDWNLSADPILLTAHPVPGRDSDNYAALRVLAQLFGGGISSRIALRLREGSGYTYTASAWYEPYAEDGVLFTLTTSKAEDVGSSLRQMLEETERLATEAILPEELEAARRVVREEWVSQLETTPGLASTLGRLFLRDEGPDALARIEAAIRAVSADELQRLANEHLSREAPIVVAGFLYHYQGSLHSAGFRDYDILRTRFE